MYRCVRQPYQKWHFYILQGHREIQPLIKKLPLLFPSLVFVTVKILEEVLDTIIVLFV